MRYNKTPGRKLSENILQNATRIESQVTIVWHGDDMYLYGIAVYNS